jgi:hypothetical protein
MYEDEYYFIRKPRDTKVPSLQADDDTSRLNYSFEAFPLDPPLVFVNSWKERNLAKGIRELISDILFEGSDMIVSDKIRNRLLGHEVPSLHMYPSVYIDDQDRWHEKYWYMTFVSRFDCWDKNKSDYSSTPIEMMEEKVYGVFKYVLDTKLLDATPLAQRLLFKMGGSTDSFITVHQSMLPVFLTGNRDGVEFQKISDFGTT